MKTGISEASKRVSVFSCATHTEVTRYDLGHDNRKSLEMNFFVDGAGLDECGINRDKVTEPGNKHIVTITNTSIHHTKTQSWHATLAGAGKTV